MAADRRDIRRICFFKSQKENDEYMSVFAESGYEVEFQPVLDCTFVNQDKLSSLLQGEPPYGLIVTSARALSAIKQVMQDMEAELRLNIESRWKTCVLYAVGKATLSDLPFAFGQTFCCDTDATALGRLVLSHCVDQNPRHFIFLSSQIRRDDLPALLSSTGQNHIELQELVVYETRSLDICTPKSEQEQWWVFFSPSGVSSVFAALVARSWPTNVKIASIGRTTAESLQLHGASVSAVAPKPQAKELLASIQSATICELQTRSPSY